ncbi:hypothetical protein [Cryobacterium sp. TMT2-14]|uniref:hypothetical protein n=1 Tax=Cryobacterium sp. TMT2-14 TaxID=1259245 RepID=UPI00106BA9EB|nr:hypothetical protein [Cryobacterium sp. TMT2-14]TFC34915.1 hypothetical protein E3O28_10925 [Cryobacterium sp. TMT2-14]
MQFIHRHRLVLAIVGSGIALAVLVAIGVYGLLRGPAKVSQPERRAPEASVSSAPTSLPDQPQPVVVTTNAELFARSVAAALFTWDTRHEGDLSEWVQVLVDVADSDEAAAVASDVRGYLPSTEMWGQLSAYGTRQWFEHESAVVPDAWSTALEQAASGQIPRGAAAFTVVGSRHRAGTWDTEVIRTERKVAFTVFVVCPGQEPCRLLRLSQLDRPLE